MEEENQPPKRASQFLKWYCRNERLEELAGDLEEFYYLRLEQYGKRKADRLFWRDVLRGFKPYAWKHNKQIFSFLYTTGMYKNYFNVAVRNMLKHRFFTLVNILGLAVSMSICMLFIHIVYEQLHYDNFHKNSENIKRVYSWISSPNDPGHALASTTVHMADYLKELGLVNKVTRFDKQFGGECIYKNNNFELYGIYAEATFFDVFTFEFEAGDKNSALNEPYSMVISSKTAKKFFGDENPVGEIVSVGDLGDFTIKGILKEPKVNTHLPIDAMASFSTVPILEKTNKIGKVTMADANIWTSYVYADFKSHVTDKVLDEALESIAKNHFQIPDSRLTYKFYAQPLHEITPGVEMDNMLNEGLPKTILWLLSILPIAVLLLAIFNYTNLSLARALKRTKEIGIRKVSGANKGHVFFQFITESVLFAVVALVLSIALHSFFAYFLSELSLINNPNPEFAQYFEILTLFLLFSVACGFLAGLVPAIYIAGFQPVSILKGKFPVTKNPRFTLRKSLVVLQFAVSLVFFIMVLVMQDQLSFIFNKDYGFDKANNLVVELKEADFQNFKNELVQIPQVQSVSMTSHLPAIGWNRGMLVLNEANEDGTIFFHFSVDDDYLSLMDLELISGSGFTGASSPNDVLINEKAVSTFGFANPIEALGHQFINSDSLEMTVTGVLKNYHFKPVNSEISPMLLQKNPKDYGFAIIKMHAGTDVTSLLDQVETTWKKHDRKHVFEYSFMDEKIESAFAEYNEVVQILGFITFIALSIACIGLFGMAMYAVENRIREVSIRKVLGATTNELSWMLLKSFLILVVVAIFLALPISWFLADMWLQEFAYRVDVSPIYLMVTSVILLLLGGGIIFTQALKAVHANLANTLKSE